MYFFLERRNVYNKKSQSCTHLQPDRKEMPTLIEFLASWRKITTIIIIIENNAQ